MDYKTTFDSVLWAGVLTILCVLMAVLLTF